MSHSLAFDEDEKRESGSNWPMRLQNTPSYDTLGSRAHLPQYDLNILYKKEIPSERPKIVATLHEKLAYYRALASSPSKTQILSMQQVLFNKYLWFYIFNVFCKSLPSTYVYVFLSSYAAEEHFFISKMIPICCGLVWHSIISGYVGVVSFSGYIVLLWDYLISGFLYKNPWNRCAPYYNVSVKTRCYDVREFTRKIQNETPEFKIFGYRMHSEPTELFQMAPILFLKSRMVKYSFLPSFFWVFQTGVLVIAALLYKQLFKKYIWKVLNYSQWALNFMYLVTFCHLVTCYFVYGFKKVSGPVDPLAVELWNADIDMLAESMTSPPVVHILSARGTEKVKPSRDSTTIIVSNAIYYVFRGLLAYMMKRYCENIIGVPLNVTEFNPCSSFFFWPIYFSYFYLGEYYTLMYFLLNSIEEFLVLVITFNCLIEAISCEWHLMKPWFVACSMCGVTAVWTHLSTHTSRSIIYVYMTCVTTLAETIAVFFFYPLGRLVDDITFHCGAPPTTFRVWNFRIAPVFYAFKCIIMLNGFLDILRIRRYEIVMPTCFIVLYVQVVPMILGALYAMYDVVYRNKQSWKQLLIPVPEWGPKDAATRRLRKQYDSREFIGSQAPRELSRYFIEKAELTTYRLDIQYEGTSKYPIWQNVMKFEDEKKSI